MTKPGQSFGLLTWDRWLRAPASRAGPDRARSRAAPSRARTRVEGVEAPGVENRPRRWLVSREQPKHRYGPNAGRCAILGGMLRTVCLMAQLFCFAIASLGGLPLLRCSTSGALTMGCPCETLEDQPSCCSRPEPTGHDCCVLTLVELDPTDAPRQDPPPRLDLHTDLVEWNDPLGAPARDSVTAVPPTAPPKPPSYLLFSGFRV